MISREILSKSNTKNRIEKFLTHRIMENKHGTSLQLYKPDEKIYN